MKKDFDGMAYSVLRDCVEFVREHAEIENPAHHEYLLELRDLLSVKIYKLEYETPDKKHES